MMKVKILPKKSSMTGKIVTFTLGGMIKMIYHGIRSACNYIMLHEGIKE